MNQTPYTVAIIVDPAVGDRLAAVAARMPVWLASTAANRIAAAAWRSRMPVPSSHREAGAVTTFSVSENGSPAAWAAEVLGDVEAHHGEYSHTPPYSVLEIIGAKPEAKLVAALAAYGLTDVQETEVGLRAAEAHVT